MPEHPAEPDTMSYAVPDDLRTVRAFVAERARRFGLVQSRVDMLVLAVSELTTNTLQHTSGGGRVRVWAGNGQLICDVTDSGGPRALGQMMPAAAALRGRGLAIVQRMCDAVHSSVVPEGTSVRICLDL